MRIAVLAIMLLAGCSPQAAPGSLSRDEVLLQVTATGEAEARPDEAVLALGVTTSGATAAAANAANSTTMSRVTEALQGLGIQADDLQTRSVALGRIEYGSERGRYQAANIVEVRIRDIAQAGLAIAAATEAGGNVVNGPELRVSNASSADNTAHAAAYREARSRADAYAEAAGLKVRRVLAIRDGAAGAPPTYDMRYTRGVSTQAAAPPPVVQPGVSRREVQVHVDFALGR